MILVTGRDAAGERSTQVIQIIKRDARGRHRWGKQPIVVYDQPASAGTQAADLLDYLFAGMEGR